MVFNLRLHRFFGFYIASRLATKKVVKIWNQNGVQPAAKLLATPMLPALWQYQQIYLIV